MPVPAFVLGGTANGLKVCQNLGHRRIPIRLFGVAENDIAARSRYVGDFDAYRDGDDNALLQQLLAAAAEFNTKPVLLYTTDKFVQFVSDHRDALRDHFQMNLPSVDAIDTVLDKNRFAEFCADNRLPAPRNWRLTSIVEAAAAAKAANYPAIVKPAYSHHTTKENFHRNGSYAKMLPVADAAQVMRYYEQFDELADELMLQEYIAGPDDEHYSFVSCRDRKLRETACFGVRKLRVFPIHAGVATFAEITEDRELYREGRRVVDKLAFTGVSSVCFKRDARDGRLKLHEMNGRLPGPQSAGLLADIDMPFMAYLDARGIAPMAPAARASRRRWIALKGDFDACRGYRDVGELSMRDWLATLRRVRVCAEFAWHDPWPFLHMLGGMIWRGVRGNGERVTAKPSSQELPLADSLRN